MIFYRYRRTLFDISIETPAHLFMNCNLGISLRRKRNFVMQLIHPEYQNLSHEQLVHSNFEKKDKTTNVLNFLITIGNYIIYKYKMKKHYNVDAYITEIDISKSFTQELKNRITSDHNRMNLLEFKETWDPGESASLANYTDKEITLWKI